MGERGNLQTIEEEEILWCFLCELRGDMRLEVSVDTEPGVG